MSTGVDSSNSSVSVVKANQFSSSCCLSGMVHEGTPTGTIEAINDLQTYVAVPKDGSKAKSIVFLVDIFGWEFKNVRLLADNYAKAGFYCYIPDVHQGGSLPIEFLQSVEPSLKTRKQQTAIEKTKANANAGTALPPWLLKHREAVSRPLIENFVAAMRKIPGTGKVGAIGFCWGGRYAILRAHSVVDAAYVCHPSLVAIPGGLRTITKPFSLAVGTEDSLLDQKSVGQIQDIIAKKTDVPHELRI
ncbi:dienelactone hydrolase family protein-like protein [Bisporella sp. PMI_857]|nr:dienelactone hydrolase family protein-like protein [Bisporella sp. PMI_857]